MKIVCFKYYSLKLNYFKMFNQMKYLSTQFLCKLKCFNCKLLFHFIHDSIPHLCYEKYIMKIYFFENLL